MSCSSVKDATTSAGRAAKAESVGMKAVICTSRRGRVSKEKDEESKRNAKERKTHSNGGLERSDEADGGQSSRDGSSLLSNVGSDGGRKIENLVESDDGEVLCRRARNEREVSPSFLLNYW